MALVEQQIQASDKAANSRFGSALAISGDFILVGAPNDTKMSDVALPNAGAVYIYKKGTNGFVEYTKLRGNDTTAHNFFGSTVAISNNYAIVGAINSGLPSGYWNCGGAYIFEYVSTAWQQYAQLFPPVRLNGDFFGSSVDISGNYAIVGAKGDSKAYIFARNGTTSEWLYEAVLTSPEIELNDLFGCKVGISGNFAVVAAENKTVNGQVCAGAVYIFKRTSYAVWSFVEKITADTPIAYSYFGRSIKIDGSYLIVGCPQGSTAAAYVYYYNSVLDTWNLQEKVSETIGIPGCSYGSAVAIKDVVNNPPLAAVGSVNMTASQSSIVYAYDLQNDSWMWRSPSINISYTNDFAKSIALNEKYLLCGAPNADSAAGSVYIFSSFIPVPFSFEQSFTWNLSQGYLYHYRIQGTCINSSCKTTGLQPNDAKCGGTDLQRFLWNISARDLTDLCTKMKDRFLTMPWSWPVLSIKKFSRPALTSDVAQDEANGIDHSCNELEEQETFCEIPECLEFCLSSYQTTYLSGTASLLHISKGYTAQGGLTLFGSAWWHHAKGNLKVFGSALTAAPEQYYTASGELKIFGTSNLEHYSYTMSGGLKVFGAAGINNPDYYLLARSYLVSSIIYKTIESNYADTSTLSSDTSEILSSCNCRVLGRVLKTRINLTQSDKFKLFLFRNNIVFPSEIEMIYNANDDIWRYSKVYEDATEKWNILAEWGCLTQTEQGYEELAPTWRWHLWLRQSKNGVKKDTKVLIYFVGDLVCGAAQENFNFTFNTVTEQTSSRLETINEKLVFFDNIELFASPSWLTNPILSVNMPLLQTDNQLQYYTEG